MFKLRKTKRTARLTLNSELDTGTNARVYDVPVTGKLLRTGDLARRTGVSADTLRHYERRGLLEPKRAANGYRVYPERAVQRVLLVRRALALGIGLDEMRKLLKSREQGRPPCRQVRELAAVRLAELEAHLLEITTACDDLRELIVSWDRQLDVMASNEEARLLESPIAADAAIIDKLARSRHLLQNRSKQKRKE